MIENLPVQNAKGIREKKIGRIMVVIAALGVAVVVHSFISLEMQHMKIKSRRAAAIVNGTSRLGSDGKIRTLGWLGMGSDNKRKGQSQRGVTATPSPLDRKPIIIAPSQGEGLRGDKEATGQGESVAPPSTAGKNPVVLALSQGRSGSTITGNLLLKSHTYCGMFIDEPIWLVYRQLLAREYDKDQSTAIDLFLSTTQCKMDDKLWGNDEIVSDWFYKRETHSEGENTTLTQDYFTKASQEKVCRALSQHEPPQAVCSKELRFLGYVRPLMKAASERGIPLTLLYQLRDPRATVFSQIWVFHRGDHTVDIGVYSIRKLRSACKVAVEDLEAMRVAPPNVQVVQLCFEDLIHRPRSTLKALYGSIPGFASWPDKDPETLLPSSTREYGEGHIKDWDTEHTVDLSGGKGGEWGGTKRSFDRYSSGKSRSDHVHVWKEAWPFIKYDGMRKVWDEDPSCVRLREISHCSPLWPHMPLNQTARNEMYASWGKVDVKELDDPNSWISKAKAQKIKKALKMIDQANELDSKGGVDEEALKAQYARWMGAKAAGKAAGKEIESAKHEPKDGGGGDEDVGEERHSAHWHKLHDAKPGEDGTRAHPKSFRNVVVAGPQGGAAHHHHHSKDDKSGENDKDGSKHKGPPQGGHKAHKADEVSSEEVGHGKMGQWKLDGEDTNEDDNLKVEEEDEPAPPPRRMGRGKNK